MKKVLSLFTGASLLFAGECFNVFDYSAKDINKISTKIVDKRFELLIIQKPTCGYRIIDRDIEIVNENNETIYKGREYSPTLYIITIPYMTKKATLYINYKTYELLPKFHIIDNKEEFKNKFAVRPDHLDIQVKPTNPIRGSKTKVKINAVSYKGKIIDNYKLPNNVVFELENNVNIQYYFNNKTKKGVFEFNGVGKTKLKMVDKHFADVDVNDSTENQRFIKGYSADLDIQDNSKFYAGAGDNKVDVASPDIKNNVNKNLQYKSMAW